MSLPNEFERRIDEIRNDVTNGSSVIAINVIKILSEAINFFDESEINSIYKIALKLLTAKPQMTAPVNIIKLFIKEFPKFNNKIEIQNYIYNLENDFRLATDSCINLTLQRLSGKSRITFITCSFSSAVFNTIIQSKSILKVFIYNSVWKGIDFGKIWQEKLNYFDIECIIIDIADKSYKIDFALLGADSILSSGDIVNGIPSLNFAKQMKILEIPLYVIAESIKKCNEIHIADGFEIVPNGLITEIISDNIFKLDY